MRGDAALSIFALALWLLWHGNVRQGTARQGMGFLFSLWLIWTNPSDPDLAKIKFYVTGQDSMHGAWIVDVPLYTVAFGDTTWRARPGMPDSLVWGSACRSAPTRYAVSCAAVDTAGNESGPSNVVDFVVLP